MKGEDVNALQLMNRISTQFRIGKWTDPGTLGTQVAHTRKTAERQAFVANTLENFRWLAELPKKFLECVSLERVATKPGSVEAWQFPSNKKEPSPGLTPRPRGLNYSETVLVPTCGDFEQWQAAADFCCGYLCVIEDSYAKARTFDFHTATTPFRHLILIEKRLQVKWIKYYTAAPMSQILNEELPATPTGVRTPVFFSGKFRNFMHQRCLPQRKGGTPDIRNLRNAFNLLQGVKKACQPISKDFIIEAFKEHRKTMSTPCAVTEEPDRLIKKKYQDIWMHGRWGGRIDWSQRDDEGIPSIVPGRWDRYKPTIFKPPGPAATLEWTRGDGGGSLYAYVLNEKFDRRERLVQSYIINHQVLNHLAKVGILDVFVKSHPDLEFFRVRPRTSGGPFWAWHEPDPAELTGDTQISDDWQCLPTPYPIGEERPGSVATRHVSVSGETYLSWSNYSPSWDEVMTFYDKDNPKNHRVMVEGCVEPLKLRTITKGPCHRKWLSQSLQREMAECLDGLWQFKLNKANTDTRLVDRLYRECENLHRKFIPSTNGLPLWWCSGDYKGATDSISIHHTKAALNTLLLDAPERVSEACKELYRAELFEQIVSYPEWTGIEDVQQVNGQLMGSVLSFPILCVINFVAYWVSLEEHYGTTLTVKQVPCLIHGDDILFRTTQEHYDHWSNVITRFGLTKSVGKNYFHQKVFTIDSELWIEGKTHGQVNFKKYFPINCGSLLGSKVDGRADYQNAPIWDKFNSSIRGALDKELFVKRFLCFNRAIIKPMTWTKDGSLNLFLPHERGGVGFVLPWQPSEIPTKEDGTPLVYLTKHQKNLASALCNSFRECGPLKAFAIVGVDLEPKKTQDERRYRLPFKETWSHESENAREVPGEVSDPVLSSLPPGKKDEYRLRKPNYKDLKKGSRRFRLVPHPPIAPPRREFRRVGGMVIQDDVSTYPTELFSFPYVRTRVLEPEVFWREVVWATRRLQRVEPERLQYTDWFTVLGRVLHVKACFAVHDYITKGIRPL